MSTGADCTFYEKAPGKWYYKIQNWPYGESENYDTRGPFANEDDAIDHLDSHYANPGGWNSRPYKAKA